jgi:hypothetical protein
MTFRGCYDASLSGVQRTNEAAWSLLPVRAVQADPHFFRCVRQLTLSRVLRRSIAVQRKTPA